MNVGTESLNVYVWVPETNPECGPDLGLLKRRTYVQNGMPNDDAIPAETDPLRRIQQEQEATRAGVKQDQHWFTELQKAINAVDPEWEWHTGEVPPPPPTGESGGSSSARDEPMTEQRQQRMHEEVYKAPCQNVFTSEFRCSKLWTYWNKVRNA